MENEFAKPRILVSRCLGFAECRYDGQSLRDDFVETLKPFVDYSTVCPEADIGLGTPRPVIRLVDRDGTKLVQPKSGQDLTDDMKAYADEVAERIDIDGFILKSGSPSCGLTAKVFAKPEPSVCVRREPGIFAQKMIDHFGESIPVEEEGRLLHATLRHHFLIRIFAFAELRRLADGVTAHKIESFHRRYKNILLLFDQNRMRSLGRIVGEHLEPQEKLAQYEKEFRTALLNVPNRRAHRNVLEHMLGHFKTELSAGEKASFKTLLVDVDEHRAPVVAPLAIVKSWVERFDYEYLRDQVYLEPYPKALVSMRDSGKGLEF